MKYPEEPPIVTVFGGGGFIGRYVCDLLLRSRARVRVVERDPWGDYFLQPLADVGWLCAQAMDTRRSAAIISAIDRSDAVINLLGDAPGGGDSADDHSGEIAAAAWAAGAKSFVHLTTLATQPDALGKSPRPEEDAVRASHPGATIIRTNAVFGEEDSLTNRIGALLRLPVVPVIAPRLRFQPIYVCDVARAIVAATLEGKHHAGIVHELAGPAAMTIREFFIRIAGMLGSQPRLIDVPDKVTVSLRKLGLRLGGGHGLKSDALTGGNLPGLNAFRIDPIPLETVALLWLVRYRRSGRFGPHIDASSAPAASGRSAGH